ncbi:hypothetical protein [Phytoactinopolyspora limicola]|uniref:hypothetical protein n=1 Tax=Phytoactinopolyspora limicola TaxID=2715536 RepID=UPI00140D19E8|nr:hypothetical protein [Phytoactinopolyspora limicola]
MDENPGDANMDDETLRLLELVPNKAYHRLIVRYPYQTDSNFAFFYQESAERLASTYRGKPEDDTILMPFLMLYRHAFELEIKDFIRFLAQKRHRYHEAQNGELRREEIDKKLRHKLRHNLEDLLNELLQHYDTLALPEEFPQSVKDLVDMLHAADRGGTAFRYAGGLPDSQDYADFPDLVELLRERFELLQAVYSSVEALYDAMPEPEEQHY